MNDYNKFFITPFLIALQLLTRIPVRIQTQLSGREIGCSLIYYPLTGLLIGLIVWISIYLPNILLDYPSSAVLAAIGLGIWVIITGALHIDGLADSADAWIGGFGDREKMQRIMKDSRSGPIAITVIVLLLLLKWTAIQTLIQEHQIYMLIIVPLMARSYILILYHTTPYVSKNGMASEIIANFPQTKHIYTMLAISAIISVLFAGIGIIIFSLLVFYGLRWMMKKHLGGTTGDTTGAMVEILEMSVLVFLALS